jgi:hypothetical protein
MITLELKKFPLFIQTRGSVCGEKEDFFFLLQTFQWIFNDLNWKFGPKKK